jgi:hypothetical protein
MCNCQNMVRTPEESQGFPMSVHHPECEDFHEIEFVKILHKEDGDGFIETKEEAAKILSEADWDCDFELGPIVKLTQDQFENLPEWQP